MFKTMFIMLKTCYEMAIFTIVFDFFDRVIKKN